MMTSDADPFDPAGQHVEPMDVSTPETTEGGKTPAQAALVALNGDQRSDLIGLAHTLNLPSDDPVWVVIRAALDAQSAAYVASEAVGKLGDAPAAIERAALQGAGAAAAEIKSHAAQAAEAVAATLGQKLEQTAAEPIGKVMRPHLTMLDERAQSIRDELKNRVNQQVTTLINEFLSNANKYVRSHSISTKAAGRMSALLLLIVGAALGVAGTKLDHRLSPTPIHSTASGGYTIRVPRRDDGRFEKCGARECVYLYRAQRNHK